MTCACAVSSFSKRLVSTTMPTSTTDGDAIVLETTDDTFTDDDDNGEDLSPELDAIANTLDVEAGQIIVNDKEAEPQCRVYIPSVDVGEMERIVMVINQTHRCFDKDRPVLTVDGYLVCKAQKTFDSLLPDAQKKVKDLYEKQEVLSLEYSDKIGKHSIYNIYCYSQKALGKFALMLRNMWSAQIQKLRKDSKTPLCIFTDVPHLKPEFSRHFFGVKGYRIKRLTGDYNVTNGLFVENIPESLFGTQQVLVSKWAVEKLGSSRDVTLEDFRKAVIAAVEDAIKTEQTESVKTYEAY